MLPTCRAVYGPATETVLPAELRVQLTLPLRALDSIRARAVVNLIFQVIAKANLPAIYLTMAEPSGPEGYEPTEPCAVQRGRLPGRLLLPVCTKLAKSIGRWKEEDIRTFVNLMAGRIDGVDGYSSPEDLAGASAYAEVSVTAGIESPAFAQVGATSTICAARASCRLWSRLPSTRKSMHGSSKRLTPITSSQTCPQGVGRWARRACPTSPSPTRRRATPCCRWRRPTTQARCGCSQATRQAGMPLTSSSAPCRTRTRASGQVCWLSGCIHMKG